MSTLAWHFLPNDGCLRYGARVKVEAGKTYTADGPLVMCGNGMHASVRAIDALKHAHGVIVCRVELSGEGMLICDDMVCARHRKVLWLLDASRTLHEFACWCSERALTRERKAGREPDPQSWAAIKAKRDWLAGKIGDAELSAAAAEAAWAALAAAAWAALEAAWAARSAARAAEDAARSAAWAAARAAARAAEDAVAEAAERDAQNAQLETMLGALQPKEGA